jgi:hypothetical protein
MNPIITLASAHIASGNRVISIFADSSTAGIYVQFKDGTEVPYEIEGGDPSEYQKWGSKAAVWLSKANSLPF